MALANTGERFGYYTMLAIFTLFLQAKFGYSAGETSTIFGVFLGAVYFVPLFGGMLTEAVRQSGLLPRLTAVTYVPMPPERERHRGYNQSKLLAQYLAGELGLPLREGVLARDGRATAHAAAGRAARITLAKESYRAGERKLPPGEHILLIDDIITTGATLENCAALLLAQGAESVTAAAVLRTPRPEGKKLEGNKG